jgi:hypothetical protein
MVAKSLILITKCNMIIQDYLDELSIGSATGKLPTFFIARFRGFNDGGSNKTPATSPIPEPAILLLLSIGIAGIAGVGA